MRTSWITPPWLRFPAGIINIICIFLTLCGLVGFLSSRPATSTAKANPGPGMIELLIAMFFFAVSSGLCFASHFVDHKATAMIEAAALSGEGQRLFADLERGKAHGGGAGSAAPSAEAAAAAAGGRGKNKSNGGAQGEPEPELETGSDSAAENHGTRCSVS